LGTVVSRGMTMYQLSGEGAIVGVSVTGAKYYKNDDLNAEIRDEPASSATASASLSKYQAKYHFFDDILVPRELEYDQEKSFVYETPQFKAGALYFTKWNLDFNSLFDFFMVHMEKDGWKTVTSYRGKESYLTFYKPDRGCTIRITESWLGKVYVEIRVGPADVKKN